MSAVGAGFPRHGGGVSVGVSAVGRKQHHLGHSREPGLSNEVQERPDLALVSCRASEGPVGSRRKGGRDGAGESQEHMVKTAVITSIQWGTRF